MPIDIAAHALDLFLGPVALLLHLPELNVALGDASQLLESVVAGDLNAVVSGIADGRFDVGTRTLTSVVGTVLWVGIAATVVGQFGELGELGELGAFGDLLELFD